MPAASQRRPPMAANGAAGNYAVVCDGARCVRPLRVSVSPMSEALRHRLRSPVEAPKPPGSLIRLLRSRWSLIVLDGEAIPSRVLTVTFAAPASGASAGLSSMTATTDAGGLAQVTATANLTAGSYPGHGKRGGRGHPGHIQPNQHAGSTGIDQRRQRHAAETPRRERRSRNPWWSW